MKLFVENWRKHLDEQDNVNIQSAVLNEISENDYEMIKRWMTDAPDSAYSFDNLFKGKKRVAIPVETGAAKGPIGEIVRFFQDNGWKIDFGDSTVSKKISQTIPKGPRAGEKITQTKKIRIGKALAQAQKLMKDYDEYVLSSAAMADEVIPSGGPPSEAQLKSREVQAKVDASFPDLRTTYRPGRFLKMIEFWSEKSEYYRQNPEAAFEKESPFITILSRHPVDVVRMSDMNDIRSCHSRGGGYFQCAVAESRGHGPIAYLVSRKQFEQYFDVDLSETSPQDVDLDAGAEEIFADEERGIRGLSPEGRVRLRKFVGPEDQQVAVPERATYAPSGGRTPPNFLKGVTDWALENQKEIIGDPKEIELDDWERHGGSYEDTEDGEAFGELLKSTIDDETYDTFKAQGNIEHEYEEEEEIQTELEGGSVEAQAEEVQDHADQNFKHIYISHEVMDEDMDGPPRVWYSGGIQFDLDDFGEPAEGDWDDHEDDLTEVIIDVLNKYDVYPESGNVEVYDNEWRTSIDPDYDDEPTPEGFERFVSNLEGGDTNYNQIIKDIKEELIDKDLIVPQISQAAAQFKTYKNIAPQINEKEKKVSVFLKHPVIFNNNPASFKQYDLTTQEKIKALFRENFTTQLNQGYLKPFAEKADIYQYHLNPYNQGIHVDLDGVKLKFQLDLFYTEDDHFDSIKRFLNMVNINVNFADIIQVAKTAYVQALETIIKAKEPSIEKNLKTSKVNDKMLFESWRRYLVK